MDPHIDTDSVLTEARRARFKCAGCGSRLRVDQVGVLSAMRPT
jgi:hypothetical protein